MAIYQMVDMETLGQIPLAAVFSIGGVFFHPSKRQLYSEFYMLINPQSCIDLGMISQQDTLDWWEKQSPEARKELDRSFSEGQDIKFAIGEYFKYLKDGSRNFGGVNEIRMMSNGADFDLPILTVAAHLTGQTLPWKFWNNRCFRTLKNMKKVPEPKRDGVFHNALDDAIHQARWCCDIVERMKD